MNQWPIFITQELLLQDRKWYYKLQALTIKKTRHSKGKNGLCWGVKVKTSNYKIWEERWSRSLNVGKHSMLVCTQAQGVGYLIKSRSYLHGTIKTKYVTEGALHVVAMTSHRKGQGIFKYYILLQALLQVSHLFMFQIHHRNQSENHMLPEGTLIKIFQRALCLVRYESVI